MREQCGGSLLHPPLLARAMCETSHLKETLISYRVPHFWDENIKMLLYNQQTNFIPSRVPTECQHSVYIKYSSQVARKMDKEN